MLEDLILETVRAVEVLAQLQQKKAQGGVWTDEEKARIDAEFQASQTRLKAIAQSKLNA